MATPQKEEFLNPRNLMIAAGIVMLLIAAWLYIRPAEKEEPLPTEELFIQEEGAVKKSGDETETLSEEEVAEMKEEINSVLQTNGQTAELKDVNATGAQAQAARAFSDSSFYFKMTAQNLHSAPKGYFYEGWLRSGDEYISLGRVKMEDGKGEVYYKATTDRTDYSKAQITLEPDDGNKAPAKVILEGEF